MADLSPLLKPIAIGDIEAPNRVLMAPLTRSRAAQPGDVPYDLNVEYYRQRAGSGLIIAEATQISPQGKGYAFTPGIHSAEQVEGWKKVNDTVHAAGGRIVLQMWHVGRISHTALQLDGAQPVAPSAIRADSKTYIDRDSEMVQVSEPRALETDEIPGVIEQYRSAAQNAKDAGFDGVEIHGANGYLLDQFCRTGTNKRTDNYGGSLDNRLRLPIEVAEAVVGVWGAGRVGYRISPTGERDTLVDDNRLETYSTLASRLGALGLAYLHNVESFGDEAQRYEDVIDAVRENFLSAGGSVYISNGNLDPEQAAQRIAQGKAGAVAFGKLYISNPDLAERVAAGGPFAPWNRETFYGGGPEGYTDYPAMDEATA